jgi:hypothetical protein
MLESCLPLREGGPVREGLCSVIVCRCWSRVCVDAGGVCVVCVWLLESCVVAGVVPTRTVYCTWFCMYVIRLSVARKTPASPPNAFRNGRTRAQINKRT